MKLLPAAALVLAIACCDAQAGFFDKLNPFKPRPAPESVSPIAPVLTQDQMAQGLKEALSNGLRHAVDRLGHEGGFMTNLNVKIPMPERLQSVENTLRTLGQDRIADDFIATMNRAAEQAVPEAAAVFGDAVREMSIADARSIVSGPDDAATQYFRRATETNLFEKFLPIVRKATDATGATSAYKQVMDKADLGRAFGGFGAPLFEQKPVDLDAYVTDKALDGLFKMVAEEEKLIRENPMARTTDLLQKVFGLAGR